MPTDYLVDCANPEAFDKIINSWGAVLCDGGNKGKYIQQEGHYIMRIMGNEGFIKFAIENQGYGKIIKKLEQLT